MEKKESFWSAFGTFMWVRYFNAKDFLKTMFHYYRNPKFALCDLAIISSYFFKSPYRIAREYNDIEPYGETPLTTLDTIVKHAPIVPEDVVFELGSGRGRTAFWLAIFKGCKTVGVEYVPDFVQRAQNVARYFGVQNLEFRSEDMLMTDLSKATWIYLFGTALADDAIVKLCRRFEKLEKGTKIITISYPLTAYSACERIILIKTFDVEFAWGETECFIHEII